MIKRFWRWLWGPPAPRCEHAWDVAKAKIEEKHISVYTHQEIPGSSTFVRVTRFCVKCGKLVQYKE